MSFHKLNRARRLVIIHSENFDRQLLGGSDLVVTWNRLRTPDCSNYTSLLDYIELNAESLRLEYLAWVYEVGKKSVDEVSLRDRFLIRDQFSGWWFSRVSLKANWSVSQHINDAIKLMALKKLIIESNISSIHLFTSNCLLHECLTKLCESLNIFFESQPQQEMITARNRQGNHRMFSRLLKAILWLVKHIVSVRHLIGKNVKDWRACSYKTLFVSYLCNVSRKSVEDGVFDSPYWGRLFNLCDEKITARWLYIWVPDKNLGSGKEVKNYLLKINEGHSSSIHCCIDSFIDLSVIWRTLKDFSKMVISVRRLSKYPFDKKDGLTEILWPLYADEFLESSMGTSALRNLLMLNLFEAACGRRDYIEQCFYLQENQGWEMSLLAVWKSCKEGKITGIPHSTVRFWSLYYFFDERHFVEQGRAESAMPMPDFVAVNGPAAKNFFEGSRYPVCKLVEVEALRYEHLNRYASHPPRTDIQDRTLLVVTDYLKVNTASQLAILQDVVPQLNAWTILIKAHPLCEIDLDDFPELKKDQISLTNEPLQSLLQRSRVAYTSSITSAAVELYTAGLVVISFSDSSTLDLSPLKGLEDVNFVRDGFEFLGALNHATVGRRRSEIFYLDEDLNRWSKLLQIEQ